MDREAWRAAIHRVAKSRTWLSDWSDLIWSDVLEKVLGITNHQENANREHSEIHLIPVRMAIIKRTQITSVGEAVEQREPSCAVSGVYAGAARGEG